MARLTPIKTLSGFDFSFQPSLERSRIMALAALDFIDRHEVVHFIGQSGTEKSHLAIALGVEQPARLADADDHRKIPHLEPNRLLFDTPEAVEMRDAFRPDRPQRPWLAGAVKG